jgi:ABC-type amino acid transport substrate-binding protein
MRVSFRDAQALLAGLRQGTVDAVVMALLDFSLARKRDPALLAGAFVGPRASAAFGVRPGDRALLKALDRYLDGMRQARYHLMFKYLDEDSLSLIALARRE